MVEIMSFKKMWNVVNEHQTIKNSVKVYSDELEEDGNVENIIYMYF